MKETAILCTEPNTPVSRRSECDDRTGILLGADDRLQASILVSECPVPEPGENDATLAVGDGRCKGDVLKIEPGVWVLELPVMIKKHAGTFETNPEVPARVGNEAAHGTNRRQIWKRSLNQDEIGPVESNQTSFGSNPQITIGRLANGVNPSSNKPLILAPLVMYVL
jgi:hypothetical protein